MLISIRSEKLSFCSLVKKPLRGSVLPETAFFPSDCTPETGSELHELVLVSVHLDPGESTVTGGNKRKIPAIIISEQDDSQRMRECFLLGAIDFLSEPVPPEDLLSALARAAAMIHEQLIESEYRTAAEQALAALPQSEDLQPILEKLNAFLQKMKHQTATVELAADYFGFNRDYFGRYFKSKFGMTFGEFYKGFQIDYARRLLETGQFKVLEVSRLLGFSTPDYFTRVFKKHTGSVPSAVRR